MKRGWTMVMASALAGLATAAPETPKNDWENLAVNSLNRLPARTYAMPLASVEAALTDALEPATPYVKSLNGNWKFSWAGNPDLRVKDFWRVGFDDSAWFEIDVPSCVEMRGFGSPGYTNIQYPHAWDPKRDREAPTVRNRDTDRRDYNPVSSYRTTFTVPESWKGRDVILRFDGVYSAYYVWVNGRKVGYAEDSKLPSEFDITEYLNPRPSTPNLLCVEVYRWCDGSFLEDQDMFRFSGIFRDVTLWAKPRDGIWDFAVKTTPVDGYEKWKLEVGLDDCLGRARTPAAPQAQVSLYDATFKKVADLSAVGGADGVRALPVTVAATLAARAWSAEDPYLYTLVIRRGDDIRMKRVGFKEQKIVGHTFLVNGKPVKFHGVNRHESSPDNGRTVSLADMLADIRLMKRYNFDTVRTSHYPDHRLWYDLCDRYGLYVVAEANVEGHEPGYGENSLGRYPAWEHAIVERNERNVVFYRNNPSVTMWSMGNETGHGDCFRHAIAVVKKIDPSRPVHWERGNKDADVDSRMYPSVPWIEGRGAFGDRGVGSLKREEGGSGFVDSGDHTAGKCAFLCEYAHAMGNAVGNFAEYWDAFYGHESLCGGCIWDWVDQAVWKYTDKTDPKTGRRERYLAYGGDFDEQPNDGPFCCNGVIGPEREVTAKLIEVGHVHRNLVVTRRDSASTGAAASADVCNLEFELWNRFGFTAADTFDGRWELLEDGAVVRSGAFAVPAVAPLSRGTFEIPELKNFAPDPKKEYFVNFAFALKADTLWAEKGWVVARDQVALVDAMVPIASDGKKSSASDAIGTIASTATQDARTVTIAVAGTKAVFCRKSGTLCELVMNGKTVLKDAAPGVVAGPRLTCFRAFTDNDRWLRDERKGSGFYASGLSQPVWHARPIVVKGNTVRTVVEMTGSKSAGFTHEATWTFGADGSIEIANVVTPRGAMPKSLPRLGLSWKLDPSLEAMAYYGRGPRENYIDRKTGSFLGVWRSTVTDQYEPYVRPQDNGYKCDVRWVAFTDVDGRGVKFSASEPLFVQALHYDAEDIEFARHLNRMTRYRGALEPVPEVRLNLDVRQLGLGGASCGPRPMDKYIFPIEKTSWSVRIESVRRPAGDRLTSLVDPSVGTAATGHVFPGPCRPFGFVQPSPDTGNGSWKYCAGYAWTDAAIRRFSQTHVSGAGQAGLGDVGFLPFVGEVPDPGTASAPFAKARERIELGCYDVTLDSGVRVEIASGRRLARYRLTFPKGVRGGVLLDFPWGLYRQADYLPKLTTACEVARVGARRWVGRNHSDVWAPRDIHYAVEFDRTPDEAIDLPRTSAAKGPQTAVVFADGGTVELVVALSARSREGALRNLAAEGSLSFGQLVDETRAEWEEILSRAKWERVPSADRKMVATSLYRLCVQPNEISDVGEPVRYSTFSLWDTFRDAHPLYEKLVPERVPGFVNSLLAHYDCWGYLPRWELWGRETGSMIGSHAVPVIVDAVEHGFGGFDREKAYRAVRDTLRKSERPGMGNAYQRRTDWDVLDRYGYYPYDIIKWESVSRTLECCYDDARAARFAQLMGRTEDAAFFERRSWAFTNLFDAATCCFRPKDSRGRWLADFNPAGLSRHFTEGSALQWSWHVLHRPEWLVGAMGGKAAFEARLDAFFAGTLCPGQDRGSCPDVTGLVGDYAHGNEPCHHVIGLYRLIGNGDKADRLEKSVCERFYRPKPDGLCGNDDCGQMSAWYLRRVLSGSVFRSDAAGRK